MNNDKLIALYKRIEALEKRVDDLEGGTFEGFVGDVFSQLNWVDEDGNRTTIEKIMVKREARKDD